MDYNRIILELLDGIKSLEERVAELENHSSEQQATNNIIPEKTNFGGQKYIALTNYLNDSDRNQINQIKLTFNEIEKNILGFNLPPCAYNNRANWANSMSQSLARSWLKTNYRVVEVNMEKQYVIFKKQ